MKKITILIIAVLLIGLSAKAQPDLMSVNSYIGTNEFSVTWTFSEQTDTPIKMLYAVRDTVGNTVTDNIGGTQWYSTRSITTDVTGLNSGERYLLDVYFVNTGGTRHEEMTITTKNIVGIESLKSLSSPSAYVAGNQIMVTNIAADQKVSMYDILGRTLFQGLSSGEMITLEKPTGVGPYCFIAIGNEQEKRLVLRVFIIP